MANVSSSNSQKALVPKLRFPGFEGEWKEARLETVAVVNPKTPPIPKTFYYIDLESVESGILVKENIVSSDDAPSRAQRVLQINDILYQTVRPYQKNNYFFEVEREIPTVASTGYAQIRTAENPYFFYELFHTPRFVSNVLLRCTGTSYPAVSGSDLNDIKVAYPNRIEQQKIAAFVQLLEKRIDAQRRLVEALKSYKRGVVHHIFAKIGDSAKWGLLKNYAHISTGISNTQDAVENGKYPFFIRSQNVAKSNRYVYEGEAVLTIGDGQIGKVFHYINGKFDCHQRVYMITHFSDELNGKYFYHFFAEHFLMRALRMTAKNTVDSVRMEMISDMPILIPTIEIQRKTAELLDSLDEQIIHERQAHNNLQQLKRGLVQQLFI